MVNFIFWTDVLQFIRPFLTKPNISLKVEMDVINQKIVFAELSNLDESTVQEIATRGAEWYQSRRRQQEITREHDLGY